ncbi:MAG TPA: hypothetical protein VGK63_03335 [Candidatus Limnocylindrales bacterium]
MTRSTLLVLGLGLGLAVALIALASCSTAGAAYFPQPDATTITGSARVGERALVGVADLVAADGDRVELIGVTPVNLGGSPRVSAWVVRRRDLGGGGIGFTTTRGLPSALDFASLARPLEPFAFTSADGPIQVVLAVESSEAGAVTFDGVRVSFRVAAAEWTQTFRTSAAVTFESP